MYLLFQLKSHAYMYESTPQHIIDEESAPGPVANWLDSSSDDSSSSSSDSDASSGSNTTAKRIKRVMRGGRKRRKSSAGSKERPDVEAGRTRTPSFGTSSITPVHTDALTEEPQSNFVVFGHRLSAINFAEDADDDEKERPQASRKNSYSGHSMKKERKKDRKRREKRERKARRNGDNTIKEGVVDNTSCEKQPEAQDEPRRVEFAVGNADAQNESGQSDSASKKPFTLRGIRPQIPKTLSQNVFSQSSQPPAPAPAPTTGPIPLVRYGIRRTNSLPDRLSQSFLTRAPTTGLQPVRIGSTAVASNKKGSEDAENISRTTAVMLLLISTGLVAVCAEFMVDSINAVVESQSGLSETFIGLIILPIVGNAAEHVTAVTVASKNKMDLAIGVAVGSSIQIGTSFLSFSP
jgi:Ca2+:H+ antiporter